MAIRKKKKLYKYNNGGKLITYDTLKGDRRSFTGDQRKDDYINQQILTGNFGYDESSGGIVRLDNPINISEETKDLVQVGQKQQLNTQWQGEANVKAPEDLVQSYISGTNQSEEAKNAYLNYGFDKTVNNPAFQAAAYFTPPGMMVGAMQGATHLGPDAYKFAKEPSWRNAGAVGMDALMMLPAVPGAVKGAKTQLSAYKQADEYLDVFNETVKRGGTSYTDRTLDQLMYNMSPKAKSIVEKATKSASTDPRFLGRARDEARLFSEQGRFDRPNSPFTRYLNEQNMSVSDLRNYDPKLVRNLGEGPMWQHPSGKTDFYTRQTPTGQLNYLKNSFKKLPAKYKESTESFGLDTYLNNHFSPFVNSMGRSTMSWMDATVSEKATMLPQILRELKATGAFSPKNYLKSLETTQIGDIGGLSLFKPKTGVLGKEALREYNFTKLAKANPNTKGVSSTEYNSDVYKMVDDLMATNQAPVNSVAEMNRLNKNRLMANTLEDLKPGSRYVEHSISSDSQPILINQLTKNPDMIPQHSGVNQTLNDSGVMWFKKKWLKEKYGKSLKDIDKLAEQRRKIGKDEFIEPEWFKDFKTTPFYEPYGGINLSNTSTTGPFGKLNSDSWLNNAKKDWVKYNNKILKHQKDLAAKSDNPNFQHIQNIPEAKMVGGQLYVPQVIFEKTGAIAEQTAARVQPTVDFINKAKRTTAIGVGAPTVGYGSYKLGRYIGENIENEQGGQIMKYNNGGIYYGIPNYGIGGFFRNTKLGRGIRDVGVASLNLAAQPLEAAMGTDFGIDEKFGYKTKFGQTVNDVGQVVGSAVGKVGAQALNTVVPGASVALKAAGTGLENAGITQDPSQLAQIGAQAGDLYGQMNPDKIQNIAGMFTGAPDPIVAKKGLKNYKYAQGGATPKADIEAEGGELILTEGGTPEMLEGGAANKIADNAFELKGKSHSQGGEEIKMPNGQSMVISRKYADNMKNILKKLQVAKNRSKSSDVWTSNAAKRNVERLSKEASNVIAQQQSENGNKSNTVKAKQGMQYVKAQDGINWNQGNLGMYSTFQGGVYDPLSQDYIGGFDPMTGQQNFYPGVMDPSGRRALPNSTSGVGFKDNQVEIPSNPTWRRDDVHATSINAPSVPVRKYGIDAYGETNHPYASNQYVQDPAMAGTPTRQFNAPRTVGQMHDTLGLGDVPARPGQQGSFGVFNTDASPLPAQGPREGTPGENAFTESMGIRPEDMNPAYNGPEQMPEGYTMPEGYQITPPPPASKPPTKFGDRAMPAWMREQMQGLNLKDNLAQNASAYYNLLAGGIGALSEKDYLNYGDYKIDPIATPERSDMNALTANQRQMMLTAMGDGSPQRRQAMHSSFMPQLASQYAAEDARYNQRLDRTGATNANIGAKNMEMKLGIKNYNTALDAAPYEFMKEGISQFSNNALFNKNYEMMAGLSDTSNYAKGQYTGGPTGGRYMTVGDRIFDTETGTYIS